MRRPRGWRALSDHLQIQRCRLIGFLSGGAYALWFANAHPGRAERLVLVAGRPHTPMQGRFKHLMPLYNKMIAQPWLMSSFFNTSYEIDLHRKPMPG